MKPRTRLYSDGSISGTECLSRLFAFGALERLPCRLRTLALLEEGEPAPEARDEDAQCVSWAVGPEALKRSSAAEIPDLLREGLPEFSSSDLAGRLGRAQARAWALRMERKRLRVRKAGTRALRLYAVVHLGTSPEERAAWAQVESETVTPEERKAFLLALEYAPAQVVRAIAPKLYPFLQYVGGLGLRAFVDSQSREAKECLRRAGFDCGPVETAEGPQFAAGNLRMRQSEGRTRLVRDWGPHRRTLWEVPSGLLRGKGT